MNKEKEYEMNDRQDNGKNEVIQSLWNAIFSGTRLRHVGANDPRVFILNAILWSQQESKVIDVDTGEILRFPWTELEFIDPVESNIAEFPPAPTF